MDNLIYYNVGSRYIMKSQKNDSTESSDDRGKPISGVTEFMKYLIGERSYVQFKRFGIHNWSHGLFVATLICFVSVTMHVLISDALNAELFSAHLLLHIFSAIGIVVGLEFHMYLHMDQLTFTPEAYNKLRKKLAEIYVYFVSYDNNPGEKHPREKEYMLSTIREEIFHLAVTVADEYNLADRYRRSRIINYFAMFLTNPDISKDTREAIGCVFELLYIDPNSSVHVFESVFDILFNLDVELCNNAKATATAPDYFETSEIDEYYTIENTVPEIMGVLAKTMEVSTYATKSLYKFRLGAFTTKQLKNIDALFHIERKERIKRLATRE